MDYPSGGRDCDGNNMTNIIILKTPHAESCATCSEWSLAAYCHHADGVKDNDPYCTRLNISLKPFFKNGGATKSTCGFWRREAIETDAVRTYFSLLESQHE